MVHISPRPCRLGDFGDRCRGGGSFPQPETAPLPYFFELERERANAPPHGLPMVSASESVFTASFSSFKLTEKFWRLDFPLLVLAVCRHVAFLLRTQAFNRSPFDP